MAVVPKKQIRKDNLDAQIVILEAQVEAKRLELDAIARRETAVKEDREALNKEKAEFFETMKEGRKAHDVIRSTTVHVKGSVDKDIEAAQALHRQVEAKVREEEKRLIRLNSSCLNAQADLDSIGRRKDVLTGQVAELTGLVLHFEEMKVKVADIDERFRLVNVDIENKRVAWAADLENAKKELERIAKDTLAKIEEGNKAEYLCRSYTNQLYTAMNDWQVIRNRLEVRWKEHYPELDMPVAE